MKKLVILLCLVLLQSYSTIKSEEKKTETKNKNIQQNVDVTWNRILEWFDKNDIVINRQEKEKGILIVEIDSKDKNFEKFALCNDVSDLIKDDDCIGEYKIIVKPDKQGGTNINITTTYSCKTNYSYGKNMNQLPSKIIVCKTKGTFEDQLLDYAELK
jgi:hypothetical protein